MKTFIGKHPGNKNYVTIDVLFVVVGDKKKWFWKKNSEARTRYVGEYTENQFNEAMREVLKLTDTEFVGWV